MALTVMIDKDAEELVARMVADGRYATASDVVREGLRLVEERETEAELEWLRAEIQEGLDSGPAIEIDLKTWAEDVKARGLRRMAAKNGS